MLTKDILIGTHVVAQTGSEDRLRRHPAHYYGTSGGCPCARAREATRLAWGELECRRHRLHGERVPEWQCAGCREPVGGMSALHLSDGNRVHFDRLDCLITANAGEARQLQRS